MILHICHGTGSEYINSGNQTVHKRRLL